MQTKKFHATLLSAKGTHSQLAAKANIMRQQYQFEYSSKYVVLMKETEFAHSCSSFLMPFSIFASDALSLEEEKQLMHCIPDKCGIHRAY